MDDKKDIQKANPISRFFDRQTIRTNPFGANQSAERAYRRAERLAAAMYLVTKHIPATESVRSSVRAGAIRILEDVLALRNEMRADSESVTGCKASIRHQMSLVRILAVGGFLSSQNTGVIIEALDELGTFLSSAQNSTLSDTYPLSQENLSDVRDGSVKDASVIKDRTTVKDVQSVSDKVSDKRGQSVREENIISILRTGGELGIRDIAASLPEYSEKMIQRHLADLVESGRVKKVGLKRWSRYSIAG